MRPGCGGSLFPPRGRPTVEALRSEPLVVGRERRDDLPLAPGLNILEGSSAIEGGEWCRQERLEPVAGGDEKTEIRDLLQPALSLAHRPIGRRRGTRFPSLDRRGTGFNQAGHSLPGQAKQIPEMTRCGSEEMKHHHASPLIS